MLPYPKVYIYMKPLLTYEENAYSLSSDKEAH
jgi:hypothetical protein